MRTYTRVDCGFRHAFSGGSALRGHRWALGVHRALRGHRVDELAFESVLAILSRRNSIASTGVERRSSWRSIHTRLSILVEQQLLLAGARLVDVDGRGRCARSASLRSRTISHVAGALELLEDDLVHARAGVDQRGGDDGQRAALLDVARRAEEALRGAAARWSRRRPRGSCPSGGTTVL